MKINIRQTPVINKILQTLNNCLIIIGKCPETGDINITTFIKNKLILSDDSLIFTYINNSVNFNCAGDVTNVRKQIIPIP